MKIGQSIVPVLMYYLPFHELSIDLSFILTIGGIYFSSDGGSSWTKSNAPNFVTNWNGITSNSNGKYLAAGTRGTKQYIKRVHYLIM